MKETVVVLFGVIFCYLAGCVTSEEINLDLSSYRPGKNSTNVLKKYSEISDDTTSIKITHINDDIGFFLLQVHSHRENLTLSYNSTLLLHSYITGTNIGLVYGDEANDTTFYLFRNIKVNKTATILLVITVYEAMDPVPGGCNLSFDNKIAPYQVVSYNDELIAVNSQPPSAWGASCATNKIDVNMYHLFLPEYDNSDTTYFNAINKMLTVDDIKRYGTLVAAYDGYFKYHKLYSSYRGTGEVFAIIATYYKNRSSAYIPAVSYGCDLINWDVSCVGPVTDHWKFICALLLIFGLFVTFFGHKFFRFTLYLMGFTFGVFVTYFAISLQDHLSVQEKTMTSLIIGFFYGIVWVFLWWKFGVPLLSVTLAFLLAGILAASLIFNAGLADFQIYHNDANYWMTFLSVVVVCFVVWTTLTLHAHIFACSLLGSYAFITALNYYFGGHLQYILINTYRRLTVRHFKNASIDPPYQSVDLVQTILWVILLVFGCFVQWRDQRGKPPFPPNRNGIVLANTLPERTPLLNPEQVAAPQYV